MNMLKPLGRFTVGSLSALALLGALECGSVALAQAPAARSDAPAGVKKTYTKNTVFNLPVHMDERTRAALERVCLYVKSGNADWVRQESAAPSLPHFTYRVPHDGEYWFSLVTIDKSGRAAPADVATEPPALRVVVDTKTPVIDVQRWSGADGENCLRCTIIDTNPDPASIKGLVRAASGEKVLLRYADQPGVFKLAGHDVAGGTAVLIAADLAGNTITRELRLSELIPSPVQAAQALTPPRIENKGELKIDTKAADTKATDTKVEVRSLPAPVISEGPLLPLLPPGPLPAIAEPSVPLPPLPPALPSTLAAASNPSPRKTPAAERSTPPAAPTRPSEPKRQPETTRPDAAAKQMINSTHAVVDYRVDQVGPSGIGKVEVYLTPDDGQTWQKVCEDKDRRSPVEFDLPGEGVFGIRLAITNGNGFGGVAPQRGDSPTCTIEVDATTPFVQLRPIEPAVTGGALEIHWQASDRNLGGEPVSLFYRTKSDGPWQVIAKNLKNDGTYRWNFPRDGAAQFFVKIEVADLSGNLARAESANPIVLDTTEPRGTVVNVSGVSGRAGN
jgi:hypothetical protein